MMLRVSLICFSFLFFLEVANAAVTGMQQMRFDDFLVAQSKASWAAVQANVMQPGSDYAGVVLASPSTESPNYYYQWVRDAALVIKVYINRYASGDSDVLPFIHAYVDAQRNLQRLPNRSGTVTSGGIGEPKFEVNGTAFAPYWPRPQLDGPALRAIATIGFLDLVNDTSYITNVTQSLLKLDLDFVAETHGHVGFDLWEEVNGTHFFTAMAQSGALRSGAKFFDSIGDETSSKKYSNAAAQVAVSLEDFWTSNATHGGWFKSHAETNDSGIDCGSLLASIHGSVGFEDPYAPSSDRILSNTYALITSMKSLYRINKADPTHPAIGRYPEDIYNGNDTSVGNPWFLCTSAVAEVVYLAASEFEGKGLFTVTPTNQNFIRSMNTKVKAGTTYTKKDDIFASVLGNMRNFADGFLQVEQNYVGGNGSMAEQFSRDTGAQTGARDLTWSHAAFITAAQAKQGFLTYNFSSAYPARRIGNNFALSNSTAQPKALYSAGSRLLVSSVHLLSLLVMFASIFPPQF